MRHPGGSDQTQRGHQVGSAVQLHLGLSALWWELLVVSYHSTDLAAGRRKAAGALQCAAVLTVQGRPVAQVNSQVNLKD